MPRPPKERRIRRTVVRKKLGITSTPSTAKTVKDFFRHQNWAELWNEFYTTLTPAGKYKYKTAKDFADYLAPNEKMLEFVKWFIGPVDGQGTSDELHKEWVADFGQPQDWVEKRNTGGWFSGPRLKQLNTVVARHMNTLEALREAGNHFTLGNVTRFSQMMEQLDKEFNGRFFVDGVTSTENFARAHAYMEMHGKLLGLQEKAFQLYALSHGINFNDATALMALISGALRLRGAEGAIDSPALNSNTERLSGKLSQLALSKIGAYNLPMPEKMAEEIIDITADNHKKKKTVQ